MKKITFLFAFLCALATSAQITLKPHVGMNFSMFSTEQVDYDNPGVRVGLLFGAGLKVGEDWYVEPAVQWTSMTYDMVHQNDNNADYNTSIQGLRIPVMGGYQFGMNDDLIRFRLFAGPVATVLLGVTDNSDNANVVAPTKDDINSLVWGGNFGIGLDILFLYVETGYEVGFSKYFSDQGQMNFGEGKNNLIWLTLGVNIGG